LSLAESELVEGFTLLDNLELLK